MSEAVQLDAESLEKWILRFHDDLGVALDRMIRYEMRLCLADCIRFTGPKTLKAGREKVQRDFTRASKPLNGDVLRSGFSRTVKHHEESLDAGEQEMLFTFYLLRANDLIKARDYEGMNALLRKMPNSLAKYTVIPFSESLFLEAMRGPNGGVKKQNFFVFDAAAWKRQLARIQGHVGRLKAGWLPSYYRVGGSRVVGWIDRHASGARGSYVAPDAHSDRPVAIATNYALGVGRTREIAQRALDVRARSARRDFFLFLNGKKDTDQIT